MHNTVAPRYKDTSMAEKPLPKTPSATLLHDAALRHLARYASTAAGLLRVLNRRIDRWARATQPEPEAVATAREAARQEIARLSRAGLLDDAAFAAMRAQSLSRAGKSRRGIAAHLAQHGVPEPLARAALPDDPEAEFVAALALARKRRAGPFATAPADPARRLRDLAAFARAGFSQETATRALRTEREDAEALLRALRQGPPA